MQVFTTREENKLTVKLNGQLDTAASIDFSKTLPMLLKDITDITFDFSELDYITSAGLRLMLTTQKTIADRAGKMQIINLNDAVMDVFKMTHFNDILNVK